MGKTLPTSAPRDLLQAIDDLAALCERRGWPFAVAVRYADRTTRVRVAGSQTEAERLMEAIRDSTDNEVRRLTQGAEVTRG